MKLGVPLLKNNTSTCKWDTYTGSWSDPGDVQSSGSELGHSPYFFPAKGPVKNMHQMHGIPHCTPPPREKKARC